MDIYSERAHLLALLAEHYAADIYQDPDEEQGFSNVLALKINDRWLTWHISDSDLHLFPSINRSSTSLWDGHTTEEKYQHIADIVSG